MADMGTLSSLGLGSNGALSYDIIDKLKKVDEDSIIKPIDNKITENKSQQNALDNLTMLLASLKSSTSSLSYENIYAKTDIKTTGSSATATAEDGVSSQTIKLNVTNIATNDTKESKSFDEKTSTFTDSQDTLKFELASGKSFEITVDSNTTISKLKDLINENSDGTMSASILNVGGSTPYKLILKSTETGADNAITVSSTGGGTAADDLNFTTVGNGAQDAKFTYNGVSITRSSNEVDDLINGVNLKLVNSGETTIKISQDTDTLKNEVKSFIQNYNSLIDNLNETTKYDMETKEVGIFQGVSQIREIKSEINNIVFSLDKKGVSFATFGITQNSAGHLELDEATFDSKLSSDPQSIKDFFLGNTQANPEDGLFVKLNDELGSIFMNNNSDLKLYQKYLDLSLTNLNTEKDIQTQRLEDKYNILAKKFSSYDKIISSYNAASQTLQMQIDSFVNNKK